MATSDERSTAASKPTGNKEQIPRTYRSGPSDPHTFTDGPGTWVEVAINAPAEKVWPSVIDIDLPAQFSEEFLGAEWDDGGTATLGASFTGRNENSSIGAWELVSYVDRYDEGRVFGWATSDAANPGARWLFTLQPTETGSTLRFDVTIGPGPSGLTHVVAMMPDKEPRIISGRLRELHANMKRTVEGIRDIAQS